MPNLTSQLVTNLRSHAAMFPCLPWTRCPWSSWATMEVQPPSSSYLWQIHTGCHACSSINLLSHAMLYAKSSSVGIPPKHANPTPCILIWFVEHPGHNSHMTIKWRWESWCWGAGWCQYDFWIVGETQSPLISDPSTSIWGHDRCIFTLTCSQSESFFMNSFTNFHRFLVQLWVGACSIRNATDLQSIFTSTVVKRSIFSSAALVPSQRPISWSTRSVMTFILELSSSNLKISLESPPGRIFWNVPSEWSIWACKRCS